MNKILLLIIIAFDEDEYDMKFEDEYGGTEEKPASEVIKSSVHKDGDKK